MPCRYQIFENENVVSITFCGRITARCVLTMLDEIEADPCYRDGMLGFCDMRKVTDVAITATEIARFADLATGLETRGKRPSRRAILATGGPSRAAAYGFSKMVEGTENFQLEIFESPSDALDYLGVSKDGSLRKLVVTDLTIH